MFQRSKTFSYLASDNAGDNFFEFFKANTVNSLIHKNPLWNKTVLFLETFLKLDRIYTFREKLLATVC